VTEQEWLACDDSDRLLRFLSDRPPDRKMLLFAAECYRRVHSFLLPDRQSIMEELLRIAEQDGPLSDSTKLEILHSMNRRPQLWNPDMGTYFIARFTAIYTAGIYAYSRQMPGASRINSDDYPAERRSQASVFRHIIGNPFHPVAVAPAWLSAQVLAVARIIYDGRCFQDMPLLGDALEDAGCNHSDILNHCRAVQDHFRGCWVVDLLLGKK
jgi:hypothetical protein